MTVGYSLEASAAWECPLGEFLASLREKLEGNPGLYGEIRGCVGHLVTLVTLVVSLGGLFGWGVRGH